MIRYARTLSPFAVADPEVLGRKGADLVELAQIGLPVPPAFSVTTEACQHVLEHACEPEGLRRELVRELGVLAAQVGRRFGDPLNPLLVSVRSGQAEPTRGMETILDIGLNDQTLVGLSSSGDLEGAGEDERFALDCYRRLLQTFGVAVARVPLDRYAAAPDPGAAIEVLREAVEHNKAVFAQHTGRAFPQDPHEQLDMALAAAFDSCAGEPPTAVIVQAMVFGNRCDRSGSGVAFTRDPRTGDPGDHGVYVPRGQGMDTGTLARAGVPLAELRQADLASYRRLRSLMGTLERRFCDLVRIDFTIEAGRLWILEARVAERSPAVAARVAADMAEEGWLSRRESPVSSHTGS